MSALKSSNPVSPTVNMQVRGRFQERQRPRATSTPPEIVYPPWCAIPTRGHVADLENWEGLTSSFTVSGANPHDTLGSDCGTDFSRSALS